MKTTNKSVTNIETSTLKRVVSVSLFLAASCFSLTAHSMPTVSGQTISWPDDGWYQVQDANTFESLCEGGTSCDVPAGTYKVINHTSGERFEAVIVEGTVESAAQSSGPTVMGNTILFPDDGWYQVQIAGDFTSSLCEGQRSCDVEPGTYFVINHTTGKRYRDVVVTGESTGSAAELNIVDTAVAAGSFTTLVAALQATGLDTVLADETIEFTVFAPTDEAFAALGADTINTLLGDTETLSDILLYHVIAGAAVDSDTARSVAGTSVPTVNEDSVDLSISGGDLFINDSRVIIADIQTSNGIIHVIDAVLIPPADAPADTPADNVNPPNFNTQTILEIAADIDDFSILEAAVIAAGLDDALGHPDDNYTVFAPTNAAFEALGQDTINALLADPEALRNILLFHVIPGTVFTAESFGNILGFDIGAGNGGTLRVDAVNNGLTVNGVNIIAADIEANNGVIHVIDTVLIPPSN